MSSMSSMSSNAICSMSNMISPMVWKYDGGGLASILEMWMLTGFVVLSNFQSSLIFWKTDMLFGTVVTLDEDGVFYFCFRKGETGGSFIPFDGG